MVLSFGHHGEQQKLRWVGKNFQNQSLKILSNPHEWVGVKFYLKIFIKIGNEVLDGHTRKHCSLSMIK